MVRKCKYKNAPLDAVHKINLKFCSLEVKSSLVLNVENVLQKQF